MKITQEISEADKIHKAPHKAPHKAEERTLTYSCLQVLQKASRI